MKFTAVQSFPLTENICVIIPVNAFTPQSLNSRIRARVKKCTFPARSPNISQTYSKNYETKIEVEL
jgi:hypothetical protein